MPSIANYTPYETLKFCQSIAQHGTDNTAFQDIAASLNANQLIRDANSYDATRLTADALQGLYRDLLKQEKDVKSPQINGEGTNPRKRKLSASPVPNGDSDQSEEDIVHALVDKLYARFREEAIKDIKREEDEYTKLDNEINHLQTQIDTQEAQALEVQQEPPKTTTPLHKRQTSKTDISSLLTTNDDPIHRPAQNEQNRELSGSLTPQLPQQPPPQQQQVHPQIQQVLPPLPRPHSGSSHSSPVPAGTSPRPQDPSQPQQLTPNLQQQHQSPGAFYRQLPPPSPQRSQLSLPHPPPQHGFVQVPQGHPHPILPPPGMPMQPMPPPMEPPTQKRGSSASTPARNSPIPQHLQYPQPYPPYPHYQQPPPHWQHQYPQHPYPPQHMPYPPQGYYPPQQNRPGPQYQTPPPGPFQQYPHTAPVPYPGQPPHGWQPSPSHPPYSQPHSASTTPVPPQHRPRFPRSGSSTPWKRRQLPPGNLRPPSPTRPVRDVSPLSDTEPDDIPRHLSAQAPETEAKKPTRATRGRARPPSVTPSVSAAAQSRSQSIASRKSETPSERPGTVRRGAQKIKTETPSTPLPLSSEADQSAKSTGRRGRPRTGTVTSTSNPSKPELTRTGTVKRKHASIDQRTPSPALPSPSITHNARNANLYQRDPELVLVSKNFAKTSLLVLNEVSGHRLAGIFAKPLSERDAPGYKDLVLRTQDLKSIRTAVLKGSKAAVGAIEALEEIEGGKEGEEEDGEMMGLEMEGMRGEEKGVGEREVGDGMYLVKKTEELAPPRGIVNAGQLEMELVRMFANAVMFNPLSTRERGFGKGLRLRRNGGEVSANVDGGGGGDDEGKEEGAESEEEMSGSDESEGAEGIIADAREMFEDTMEKVREWRRVEGERMESRKDSIVGEGGGARGSSVDAPESEAGEGEGERRKRRRVGD